MKRNYILSAAIACLLIAGCEKGNSADIGEHGEDELEILAPVAIEKFNKMKVYVHYMPWFEDKTTNNGTWGQHWTMATMNPDNMDNSGRREIASLYYPLIGPYASSDADVIEYHLLLMKYSGIDGVLIDWYGTRDLWDYPANKRNTEALVAALDKVGLDFAIVYEDQTLKENLDSSSKIAQAKLDMSYLEGKFFNKESYIKVKDKPLLLTFGPQQIKVPADWTTVFSGLKVKPAFLNLFAHSAGTVNNSDNHNASGEYIWVDQTKMEDKYAQKDNYEIFMGGAYPGFADFYKRGGWGDSPIPNIDYENGALFKRLLDMAQENKMDYLQLITWNDFGEGTMIEPTREFGYSYLNQVQSFCGTSTNTTQLESIYQLFNLRKQNKDNSAIQKKLSQVFYYFVSMQSDKAIELLNEVKTNKN